MELPSCQRKLWGALQARANVAQGVEY
jgi:hypothetical protein